MDQDLPQQPERPRHGLVLGKFLPPHRGHVYLVDFARRMADQVTLLVCTLQREPIPGHLRYQWMRRLFAGTNVRVVHVTREVPQEPSEHPDFWAIWKQLILEHCVEPPDAVFASEDYGPALGQVLGARYFPVDPPRRSVQASGREIRADPMRHWDHLPDCVRPYFVKRVCLFGPESTGKTTLARRLAQTFATTHAPEYARPLLDLQNGHCNADDIPRIAMGQIASEDALSEQANRVLFCDTDPLTTTVWCRELFGKCPAWLEDLARRRHYDLTLLLDVDVPWVNDHQRFLPHRRQAFFAQCEQALQEAGRTYQVIRGDWDQRHRQASDLIELLCRPLHVSKGGHVAD